MTKTEQNLLEISRKNRVSESDMDYFEDHIEKYPYSWGNLYLWSIDRKNYEITDYILSIGFNPNNDSLVYKEMIDSFSLYRRNSVRRIIQDGFEIDKQFIDKIQMTVTDSPYFDFELFEEVKLNERKKKIYKILGRIRAAV